MLELRMTNRSDCPRIHAIQVKAFAPLLEKYLDFDTNPAAESVERIYQRYEQPFTDYYFIERNGTQIGMLRVCDFGETCRLSPICILPEYQGYGYAQQAINIMEKRYPAAKRWELDTILQETKLCYLYEKLGYKKTGKFEKIKDGMDLVFYAKGEDQNAGTCKAD